MPNALAHQRFENGRISLYGAGYRRIWCDRFQLNLARYLNDLIRETRVFMES
jgi:hypothetical protein